MCGIAGIVRLGRPPLIEPAQRMAELLAHRGPDGAGSFSDERGVALAHRRLAIIDLSDAGLQPFASADGTLRLIYNGEIYNYRELRSELAARGRQFTTTTDTEVLLAAYEAWGTECVTRFNGMWAFALWDSDRERLFCSRDRFGVKPFYYRYDNELLAFASEPKAFRAAPGPTLEPELTAVRDYLEQGYVDHLSGTFFAGIVTLPPAHSLMLDRSGLYLSRYWQLDASPRPASDEREFRALFMDSVRLRLRSDVTVGTALSGGLDSSSIACAIDDLIIRGDDAAPVVGPRQRTFTAYFEAPGFDERPYAEAVAARIRGNPRHVTFSDCELVDAMPQIVAAQGEPFGSSSIAAQWFVMRAAAAADVRVMLDGQGGDEVLAGYPSTTFSYHAADLLASGRLGQAWATLAAYRHLYGTPAWRAAVAAATPFLPPELRWRLRGRRDGASELLHRGLRGLRPTAERLRSPFPDRLRRQYHLLLCERGLPELLRYEDRNSMAHSIEARVPFLDYRLVSLAYSLPAAELLCDGVTKSVLRRSLTDLLPPVVRDRVEKLGFVTPGGSFFRGALGRFAADVFAQRRFAQRGFVEPEAARRRLEAARTSGEDDRAIWRALSLELWARQFLD
jgi:asparagine synthase (glutamine-hydrolysing)